MAVSEGLGYRCEVIDSVPENSLCHHCNLLAKKLTFTSCCGESYCHGYIAQTQEEGKPCPACGIESFTTVVLLKHQKQIESLQVYCSKKLKGCEWRGSLGELDTHLDPDLDNCQYVDTNCPLHCLQAIPKNKVDQHVAQECSKRPYFCQHCGFKATYGEVVNVHLPECKYVPLQCPNFCGVSCEREDMEDHIRMCRLEELDCTFCGVGCQERFVREQEDRHLLEHSQRHLSMTAVKVVGMSEQFESKVLQLEGKIRDQEQTIGNLEHVLSEKQLEIQKLEEKLEEVQKSQENNVVEDKEMENKFQTFSEEMEKKCNAAREEMELKYNSLVTKMQQDHELEVKQLWLIWKGISTGTDKRFEIEQYSEEKKKESQHDKKSGGMHTHINGYKFCIGVSLSGTGREENLVSFNVYAIKGWGDDTLRWPAWIKLTIEILNHRNGENARTTLLFSKWERPAAGRMVLREPDDLSGSASTVKLGHVEEYLLNDTMFFHVSDIIVI